MKGRPTPREIITKPDPKILESLEEHGKTQQQIDSTFKVFHLKIHHQVLLFHD